MSRSGSFTSMKSAIRLVAALCALGAASGFYYGVHSARIPPSKADERSPVVPGKAPARVSILGDHPATTTDEERIRPSELVALWIRTIPARDREGMAKARRALAGYSLADVKAAMTQIEGIKDPYLRGQIFQILIDRWAQWDPETALDYTLEARFPFPGREAGFERIFRHWAKTDPAGAFAGWKRAGDAVENEDEIQHGVLAIFSAWAQKDLDAAFDAFHQIGHGGNRFTAINGLVDGGGDPTFRERLIEKIQTLESPPDRKHAWESLVRSWAQSASPEDVAAWIDTSASLSGIPSEEVDAIERSLAREQMSTGRDDGIAWLLERADEESLPGHLETIVSDWVNSEPNACGVWLRERGLGPETDRAVATYAEAVVRDDATSAFAWASSIHDGSLRSRTLGRVASLWYRMDPAAAEAAIEAAPFTEDEKRMLHEKRKR